MRIILAGQKSFGAAALEAIRMAGHTVASVWSPPSMDDGLTQAAAHLYDPVWRSPHMRTPDHVAMDNADLFVAAHSHDFISAKSRAATKLGGIGYHPSLLPRHRGRDAVRWTVHMGDAITGGSVYWLTDNVDGGPIAKQDWCFVPGSGSGRNFDDESRVSALWREQLFPMGIRLLVETLGDIEERLLVEVPQDEQHATWEPSWERPPLFKPDLTQIGPGPNGYRVRVTR